MFDFVNLYLAGLGLVARVSGIRRGREGFLGFRGSCMCFDISEFCFVYRWGKVSVCVWVGPCRFARGSDEGKIL